MQHARHLLELVMQELFQNLQLALDLTRHQLVLQGEATHQAGQVIELIVRVDQVVLEVIHRADHLEALEAIHRAGHLVHLGVIHLEDRARHHEVIRQVDQVRHHEVADQVHEAVLLGGIKIS